MAGLALVFFVLYLTFAVAGRMVLQKRRTDSEPRDRFEASEASRGVR